jgi:hypothetical protein
MRERAARGHANSTISQPWSSESETSQLFGAPALIQAVTVWMSEVEMQGAFVHPFGMSKVH